MLDSQSPAQTQALGAALAARLSPGNAVWLYGGLGVGKTAFVRGLADGLGYTGPVSSPTFALVHEYHGGRMPLFHFDLYRLSGWDELWDIGWDDYTARSGLCAVEWSERLPDGKEGYTVRLTACGPESRTIVITDLDGKAVIL